MFFRSYQIATNISSFVDVLIRILDYCDEKTTLASNLHLFVTANDLFVYLELLVVVGCYKVWGIEFVGLSFFEILMIRFWGNENMEMFCFIWTFLEVATPIYPSA